MAIITISRRVASLGDEIAKSVAGQLGYDCIAKLKMDNINILVAAFSSIL